MYEFHFISNIEICQTYIHVFLHKYVNKYEFNFVDKDNADNNLSDRLLLLVTNNLSNNQLLF